MPNDQQFVSWILIWLAVVLIVVWNHWRQRLPAVGLSFAYLFSLSINHLFGAVIYTLPWFSALQYDVVHRGFVQSVYGVCAFAAGNFSATFFSDIRRQVLARKQTFIPNPVLPMAYILTGAMLYFVLLPVVSSIPSIRVLALSGWSLMIVGVCLACWQGWLNGRKKIIRWATVGLFFPILTMVSQGFLGYGIAAMSVVLLFIAGFYRPRWRLVVLALVSIYMGLSLFVTYMRDREEIRRVVWYERQPFLVRIQSVADSLKNFEYLNLYNEDHLARIDGRLNQNMLVGRSLDYLESGRQEFARGETLWQAMSSVVPRIVWPEKPVVAGSGDLVSEYTGIYFAEGTSVGIGQVMEFYINFGTPCVVIGFFLLGFVITRIDIISGIHLIKGDWQGFTFWFLPGLGFLQSGGSLVEVVSTVVASFLFCFLVNKYLLPRFAGFKLRLGTRRQENRSH